MPHRQPLHMAFKPLSANRKPDNVAIPVFVSWPERFPCLDFINLPLSRTRGLHLPVSFFVGQHPRLSPKQVMHVRAPLQGLDLMLQNVKLSCRDYWFMEVQRR